MIVRALVFAGTLTLAAFFAFARPAQPAQAAGRQPGAVYADFVHALTVTTGSGAGQITVPMTLTARVVVDGPLLQHFITPTLPSPSRVRVTGGGGLQMRFNAGQFVYLDAAGAKTTYANPYQMTMYLSQVSQGLGRVGEARQALDALLAEPNFEDEQWVAAVTLEVERVSDAHGDLLGLLPPVGAESEHMMVVDMAVACQLALSSLVYAADTPEDAGEAARFGAYGKLCNERVRRVGTLVLRQP